MSIGIIDSGLGGYSIFHALHQAYPTSAFVFLADQKNAPYGNKTPQEIIDIATRNIAWFKSQNIKEIVIACNTMTAVALDTLKEKFPDILFHDVVSPTVNQVKDSGHKNWLVVATHLTIESHVYPKALVEQRPDFKVLSCALPRLVNLVEGLAEEEEIEDYLRECLSPDLLSQEGLVLGCTHYPMAMDSFRKLFKGVIVDSIEPMVALFKDRTLEQGPSVCLTTRDASFASHQVEQLFKAKVHFERVEV